MSNQNHDSVGRFSSGDDSGGNGKVTNTVRESVALRAMTDMRKFKQTRTSNRYLDPASMHARINPNQRGERADAPRLAADIPHLRGVDTATSGKTLATLADVSAKGTAQGAPLPKLPGG